MVLKLAPLFFPSIHIYTVLGILASLWVRIFLQIHFHGEFIFLLKASAVTTILTPTKFVFPTLTAIKLQCNVSNTSSFLLNSCHKITCHPGLCCPCQLCQFTLLFTVLRVFLLLCQCSHLTNTCWILTTYQVLLMKLEIQQSQLIKSIR